MYHFSIQLQSLDLIRIFYNAVYPIKFEEMKNNIRKKVLCCLREIKTRCHCSSQPCWKYSLVCFHEIFVLSRNKRNCKRENYIWLQKKVVRNGHGGCVWIVNIASIFAYFVKRRNRTNSCENAPLWNSWQSWSQLVVESW